MVNKKWFPFVLVIVLGIVLFFVKRCQADAPVKPKPRTTTDKKKDPASDVDRNRGFDGVFPI